MDGMAALPSPVSMAERCEPLPSYINIPAKKKTDLITRVP
jgi:hypothetical protein